MPEKKNREPDFVEVTAASDGEEKPRKPRLYLVISGTTVLKGFPDYKEALTFAEEIAKTSVPNNLTVALRCAAINRVVTLKTEEDFIL